METSTSPATDHHELSAWQQWLQHPEKLWVHRLLFQIHLWIGMVAGLYVLVMSLSGSMIVARNQLEASGSPHVVRPVEWLVNLHENLLSGETGSRLNGIGAICFALLCLTGAVVWWPGILHWRRSLSMNWRSSFARANWDLHNVLGFWTFVFLMMWGVSGIYFSFPQVFNAMVDIVEPSSSDQLRFGDVVLLWLSNLHFGRFNGWTEALWVLLGLVPAVLAFTGMFMCCHRLLVRKGAPLPK